MNQWWFGTLEISNERFCMFLTIPNSPHEAFFSGLESLKNNQNR